MAKREKLYLIDEVRLTEIFLILEKVRGSYIQEIENKLDEIEDSVNDLIIMHGNGEDIHNMADLESESE